MFSEGKATKENISVFWFIWPLMKDFPLLLHTSTCDFLATFWYTWCLKEVPFGRSIPDYETVHHEIMNRRWVDPRTWMVIEDWRKNEWNKKESKSPYFTAKYERKFTKRTENKHEGIGLFARKSLETITNVSFLISSCFNGPKWLLVFWLHGW